MQVVAALKLDKKKSPSKSIDDLQVISQDSLLGSEIAFYGFIRDIDYTKGLCVIASNSESLPFDAVAICDPKLFSIPQNFLLKPELAEEMMAVSNEDDNAYLLTDLLA